MQRTNTSIRNKDLRTLQKEQTNQIKVLTYSTSLKGTKNIFYINSVNIVVNRSSYKKTIRMKNYKSLLRFISSQSRKANKRKNKINTI